MKTHIHKKTWARVFTWGLFTTAPNWRQLKCPSTDKWINKLQNIHAMEYYSVNYWYSDNMDESLKYYSEWMKPNKVFIWNLYEILEKTKLMYNARKHKNGCLGSGVGRWWWGRRDIPAQEHEERNFRGCLKCSLSWLGQWYPAVYICQNSLNSPHTH